MSDVMDSGLVQITSKNGDKSQSGGMNRRSFLKVLGAASAAGVAGCADSAKQKVYPNVKGQENEIPGVAVWYNSTCTECSAGCGISVRTREGRVVKVEGNAQNPMNKGGLCSLGQSAVQGLYDPDRVRQPLQRKGSGDSATFEPISWKDAFAKIGSVLKKSRGKTAVFTKEWTGAMDELLTEWSSAFRADHVTFDSLQPVALARAAKMVFGEYGVPTYRFDKAEVILNFGADFLETWISPTEFARGWADSRRSDHPVKVFHVEPRLSLTAANADAWYTNTPGSEVEVALVVLKLLLEQGKGKNLSEEVRGNLRKMVRGVSLSKASKKSGIAEEKILLMVERLKSAKHSLVLAGGTSASSSQALELAVVTSFLNLVLSNVGETVLHGSMRQPKTSASAVRKAIDKLRDGAYSLVLVDGSNPAFTLPKDSGFAYAVREGRVKAAKDANPGDPFLVSFSSMLDETAQEADLILPASHALESWGDSAPRAGVRTIVQPAMTPVFDTKAFGDSLLALAAAAGKADVGSGATDMQAYVQSSWKKAHESLQTSKGFDAWWRAALEAGGFYDEGAADTRVKVKVDPKAYSLRAAKIDVEDKGAGQDPLLLLPFPSVKSFDGRAANRPWMHEIPDPVTQVVWDSWAEIHPETAKAKGVSQGDFVTVRNFYGEVNVPAYVTDHVHPGVVAVPLGYGHSHLGRYADQVAHAGNVMSLIASGGDAGDGALMLGAAVEVMRGRGDPKLVKVQGSDSQLDRDLARSTYVDDHGHGGDHGGHHGGHHEPKQMYDQREHPLYEWTLTVDLAACTGCSACVTACYAENNIPAVGKDVWNQGREMPWLRIERYFEEGPSEELQVSFLPMMCQHCNNAPCEPVCPVYATYHNEEGLNAMVYNRCVGTRYCSNNCTYKVRRFNWYEFDFPAPLDLQLNPDVTKRAAGVMEKCSFCVQRINEAKDRAKDEGRLVADGEVQPACVQSCPTQALAFGNINDKDSTVSHQSHDSRAYKVLDHHINTQPSVVYMERKRYREV